MSSNTTMISSRTRPDHGADREHPVLDGDRDHPLGPPSSRRARSRHLAGARRLGGRAPRQHRARRRRRKGGSERPAGQPGAVVRAPSGSSGVPNRRSSQDSIGDRRSATAPSRTAAEPGASAAERRGVVGEDERDLARHPEAVLARLLRDVAWPLDHAAARAAAAATWVSSATLDARIASAAGGGLARLAHLAREQDDDPRRDQGAEQQRDATAREARDGQVRRGCRRPTRPPGAGRGRPRAPSIGALGVGLPARSGACRGSRHLGRG